MDRWAEREGDELRFLNSGFYMGPAGLLLHLFDTAFYLSKQNPRGSNDQQYYADVMQQFGDLVTLDYAMVLVINLAYARMHAANGDQSGASDPMGGAVFMY